MTAPVARPYAELLAEPRIAQILMDASDFAGSEEDARSIARHLMRETVEDHGVVAKLRSGQLVFTFDIMPPSAALPAGE